MGTSLEILTEGRKNIKKAGFSASLQNLLLVFTPAGTSPDCLRNRGPAFFDSLPLRRFQFRYPLFFEKRENL